MYDADGLLRIRQMDRSELVACRQTKFEELERDEQGYSQVNSLFAIIEALRPLPGRKSVVLFSEGVSIPPAVLRLFTGVIDAANRIANMPLQPPEIDLVAWQDGYLAGTLGATLKDCPHSPRTEIARAWSRGFIE